MPHALELKAKAVLADRANYPEVVIAAAADIEGCFAKKRMAIKLMWINRSLWLRWIKAQQAYKDKPALARRRGATAQLRRDGFSEAELNVLYEARAYLGECPVFPIMVAEFDSSLQLVACTDISLIHRYLACVNAKRYDLSVAPVSFIRSCSHSVLLEILAWKFLRSTPD